MAHVNKPYKHSSFWSLVDLICSYGNAFISHPPCLLLSMWGSGMCHTGTKRSYGNPYHLSPSNIILEHMTHYFFRNENMKYRKPGYQSMLNHLRFYMHATNTDQAAQDIFYWFDVDRRILCHFGTPMKVSIVIPSSQLLTPTDLRELWSMCFQIGFCNWHGCMESR
jgi:hypothetical protein